MPLVVKDRVQETTTTVGTGTYTLAGAVTGYQSFSVVGDANTTYYAVTDGTNWEVGIGTYTLSGTTLTRDTILESSNSGNAVSWGAGTKNIFVTYPAEKAAFIVASDTAPTYAGESHVWVDTTTGMSYVYYNDGTSSQWISAVSLENTVPGQPDFDGGGAFSSLSYATVDGEGAVISTYPYFSVFDCGLGDSTYFDPTIEGGAASTSYASSYIIDAGIAS